MLKAYLRVREVARLVLDREPDANDVRRTRIWLTKSGALMALPGCTRRLYVSTDKLRDLYPEAYERLLGQSVSWSSDCLHPVDNLRAVGAATWCPACGAIYSDGEWHHVDSDR